MNWLKFTGLRSKSSVADLRTQDMGRPTYRIDPSVGPADTHARPVAERIAGWRVGLIQPGPALSSKFPTIDNNGCWALLAWHPVWRSGAFSLAEDEDPPFRGPRNRLADCRENG